MSLAVIQAIVDDAAGDAPPSLRHVYEALGACEDYLTARWLLSRMLREQLNCMQSQYFGISSSLATKIEDDAVFLRDKAEWTNLCVASVICMVVPVGRSNALTNQFESFDDVESRMRELCLVKPLFACLRHDGEYPQVRMTNLAANFISMAEKYCCKNASDGHENAAQLAISDAVDALCPLMNTFAILLLVKASTKKQGYVPPSFTRMCYDDDTSALVCELLIERGDYPDHISVAADALSWSELQELQLYAESYERIESTRVLTRMLKIRWAIVFVDR